MPLRDYRCTEGHEFSVYEAMDAEPQTGCDRNNCSGSVERMIQLPQRPIVKGGTKLHHGTRGVT